MHVLGVQFLFGLSCLVAVAVAVVVAAAADVPVYSVSNLQQTDSGITATLTLKSGTKGPYGSDIANLNLQIFFETVNRVHLKITDAEKTRWEVPYVVMPESLEQRTTAETANYKVVISNDPFAFQIIRGSDEEVVFDTNSFAFVFEDQYLSLTTHLPNNPHVYGLGERIHPFHLNNNDFTYTMFSQDLPSPPDVNIYGVHPFYMEYRNGKSHGVFLLNSNAMDVTVRSSSLEYRTIGGVFDFYFFMGPDPEAVVQQYQEVIGKPFLPPAWVCGFQQSRYGYQNIQELFDVVGNYSLNGLPLNVMYSDIDYMDAYKDFTWDPVRYPLDRIQQFSKLLHSKDMQYVTIVDPGIHNEQGYEPYDSGLQQGVFVMRSEVEQPDIGKVWPGTTAFPDFLKKQTPQWWTSHIAKFVNDAGGIDGIWCDMNEVSSEYLVPDCKFKQIGEFNPEHPPFRPGLSPLSSRTLCMSDRVGNNNTELMYNYHSFYGFTEAMATANALIETKGTRPFVLSRSSFAGHGHHAAHWLGDNWSTYRSMKESVSGVLNFNLFGVPVVGADICGFMLDTTPELCARWMALGSFYVFSRNHNMKGRKPQEPYLLGPEVLDVSRKVLLNRLALTPYLYSQLYRVHLFGGTISRAMFHEFPGDVSVTADLPYMDEQFMYGAALLVSPVFQEGADSKRTYIPPGRWFDYWTGVSVANGATGAYQILPASLTEVPVPVLIRGGFIVPRQLPGMTVAETVSNPFDFQIALDSSGNARGEVYMDDGLALDSATASKYSHLVLSATSVDEGRYGSLTSSFDLKGYASALGSVLGSVTILGSQCTTSSILMSANGKDISKLAVVNVAASTISVSGLQLPLGVSTKISWKCT
eukprot:ANDGO_08168.mRNA.1 putative alpha-glucosidase Os06g0675700